MGFAWSRLQDSPIKHEVAWWSWSRAKAPVQKVVARFCVSAGQKFGDDLVTRALGDGKEIPEVRECSSGSSR